MGASGQVWPRMVVFLSAGIAVAAALSVLLWWVRLEPAAGVRVGLPGKDDPLGHRKRDEERRAKHVIQFGAITGRFEGKPSRLEGDWPQFRGPNLNNVSSDKVRLAGSFPPSGPRLVWELELGEGYGGAAVFRGCVYVLDYLTQGSQSGDVLRCLSLDDGREIWRCGYPLQITGNHGITRTVPAVTESCVVTLGPMGHVMCVDTATGRARWGLDLIRQYGTRDLSKCWYAGQCPLIDGDRAIIAPSGSNVMMLAASCATGRIEWQAPNTRGWKMSHASITPMTVGGRKTYVHASVGGVAAVAAEGPDAGRILWESEDWSSSVVMPSPVVLDGDRLFLTSGYDGGNALLQVTQADGVFSVSTLYNFKGKKRSSLCFSCYQQTPIVHAGRLFGIQSNDAKERKMEFVCVDPTEPGGKIVWGSGAETVLTAPKKKEAWGPYILADGKFYVVGDTGLLVVFEASTRECRKLGQWQLMDGHEVWAPLALAAGRLLVRDISRLMCFDIGAGG